MADQINSELVEAALRMAWKTRKPFAGLVHHSDQGSQFTSVAFQQLLTTMGAQASMSRTGNCYDNAAMESFFSTLKSECVTRQFQSRQEARRTIFAYIEGWYNRQRLHSSLDYLSPLEYETLSGH